jgi:hypothetical protein
MCRVCWILWIAGRRNPRAGHGSFPKASKVIVGYFNDKSGYGASKKTVHVRAESNRMLSFSCFVFMKSIPWFHSGNTLLLQSDQFIKGKTKRAWIRFLGYDRRNI